MDRDALRTRSQLFTVRLWLDGGASSAELRGYVQHVTTREGRHFRSWPTMIAFLEQYLEQPDQGRLPEQGPDPTLP